VHQHRPIYDLFGGQFSDFSDDPRSEAIRRLLVEGDRVAIGEAQYSSGISQNVVNRLATFNQLSANLLYPPLPLGGSYYSDSEEGYLLSVGRICRIKRLDLLIKALPMVDPELKLKVVGTPDDPDYFNHLKSEIDKHHLKDRVIFLGRVSNEELIKLYANCLSVYYAPFDEDYGFASLEGLASCKPVIAASDSGGVLEFVRDSFEGEGGCSYTDRAEVDQIGTDSREGITHESNGVVVDPTVAGVVSGVQRLLALGASGRRRMGENGRRLVEQAGLLRDWGYVVEALLSPLDSASGCESLVINRLFG
jgi:glycosyltransferase involved in cell wall biosynthesis